MQIRELAHQVLFATRLEDKLVSADRFEDEAPGPALTALPDLPGRTERLRLDRDAAKKFPKRFEEASARGLAMHFFANHELLAMELMALMLLRFPEAPASFRAGIARTIAEEQAHLRLYVDRMHALGVELGDAPLNGYFWRTMRDAPTPLDFVVQMALTFEQANLDYCVHYRQRFAAVGDEASATLLDRVYEDEIGHVKHGLTWFERWRPPGETAWQAYTARLPEPMTAARAKGPVFDLAGRRQAGFDEDFIRRLRVHAASKGRRPRLFVFEPGMEDRWAGLRTDTKPVQQLTEDLAPVFGLLAGVEDRLVLAAPPRLEHLEHLEQAGLTLPPTQTWEEVHALAARDRLFGDRPSELVPWGFSDATGTIARALCDQSVDVDVIRAHSSKLQARAVLAELLEADPTLARADDVLGEVVTSVEGLLDLRARERRSLVVKAPFSASGRHRVRLLEAEEASESALGFVRRTLERHGAVWVAPWLDRVRDLSTAITVEEGGQVRVLGSTWLENDPSGAYRGHVLMPFLAGFDEADRRAVNRPTALHLALRAVAQAVGSRLHAAGYRGPAGVDHFVYRDEAGQARLHPLVEVNVRHTMGHVALHLHKRVAPAAIAVVRHVTRRQLGEPFEPWALRVREAAPIVRGPRGLESGVVFLGDPARVTSVLPVLSVGPTLAAARAALEPAPPE